MSQTRPGSTGEMPEPRDLPSVPDDADDTRGVHLRQLLVHPATLIITGILAALALIVVGAQVGIGAAAAGGILLIAFVVVWLIATWKAAADFFNAYAQGRGLTRIDGKSSLPAVTPLLRKGERRYAEQRFNGVLPGGLEGSLASTPTRRRARTQTATARPPTSITRS